MVCLGEFGRLVGCVLGLGCVLVFRLGVALMLGSRLGRCVGFLLALVVCFGGLVGYVLGLARLLGLGCPLGLGFGCLLGFGCALRLVLGFGCLLDLGCVIGCLPGLGCVFGLGRPLGLGRVLLRGLGFGLRRGARLARLMGRLRGGIDDGLIREIGLRTVGRIGRGRNGRQRHEDRGTEHPGGSFRPVAGQGSMVGPAGGVSGHEELLEGQVERGNASRYSGAPTRDARYPQLLGGCHESTEPPTESLRRRSWSHSGMSAW
ncbi:hypothetical protein [Piscicoccus intestinalis]|uniref:hypothetical protein n=1 Tax=Piscicoccus intestinalis TaxID=746033 RepID=UPI00157BA9D1|nr:hypothetical protein [Piscicoccus intestinalis]